MIGPFMAFSSIVEAIEGVVALLVSYYALKFYSLARERLFLALFTSFIVLGLGLLVHGVATAVVLALSARMKPIVFFLSLRSLALVLSVSEVFAYGLLAYSYARYGAQGRQEGVLGAQVLLPPVPASLPTAEGQPPSPEVLVGLVRCHPILEGIILVILAFLAFRTISNFLSKREVNPFLVGFSFLFLAAARACFVLAFFLALLYITAHALQLLAFLSLLIVLLRVVRA